MWSLLWNRVDFLCSVNEVLAVSDVGPNSLLREADLEGGRSERENSKIIWLLKISS